MAARAHDRTCAWMTDRTLRLLRDYYGPGKDGRRYMRAEVSRVLNVVLEDTARECGAPRETRTLAIAADTAVYSLPADCLRPVRVAFDGFDGLVLLPKRRVDLDMYGCRLADEGDPFWLYRDLLKPDEIGVYPRPDGAGSTFTRDSDYGALRVVRETGASTGMTTDATSGGLRRVRGAPWRTSGTGGPVREVISGVGNLVVTYIRKPATLAGPDDTIDAGLPSWVSHDLPYGAAAEMCRWQSGGEMQGKLAWYGGRWMVAKGRLSRLTVHHPHEGMQPS